MNAQGLGGTSPLNANVFLPADPQTLASKHWPKEIRDAGLVKCTDSLPKKYAFGNAMASFFATPYEMLREPILALFQVGRL